jgi:hypothetical protein
MACWTPAIESLSNTKACPTSYMMTCARGATPETVPRSTPRIDAFTARLPAAMLLVEGARGGRGGSAEGRRRAGDPGVGKASRRAETESLGPVLVDAVDPTALF